MKYQSVIHMLDGVVWEGTLDADLGGELKADSKNEPAGSTGQFSFVSNDGLKSGLIRFDEVKTIHLNAGPGLDGNTGLRFFDSVPIPSLLWVRVTFVDGEIVEGMVSNQWSTFSNSLLSLSLPDQRLEQAEVLIPHSAIAELQVITTR